MRWWAAHLALHCASGEFGGDELGERLGGEDGRVSGERVDASLPDL